MLWLTLGRTGLRISEALALHAGDLFLDHDPPFLAVLSLKKRRKTRDEVLLDALTAKAFRRYITKTLPAIVRRQVDPGDSLFPAHDGRHWTGRPAPAPAMTRRNALARFRYYARRAQLPAGVTLHSLRHYRGTFMYQRTGDLEFTREQLRHSDLKVTQGYLHQDPARVRQYLDNLSKRRERK